MPKSVEAVRLSTERVRGGAWALLGSWAAGGAGESVGEGSWEETLGAGSRPKARCGSGRRSGGVLLAMGGGGDTCGASARGEGGCATKDETGVADVAWR